MTVQPTDRVGWTRAAPGRPVFGRWRRGRAAICSADVLDRLVDAELEFVRRLPVHLRSRPAEALAVLVMLAQDHRHYAQGWISRRELRRRSERAVSDLDDLDGQDDLDDLDATRVRLDLMGPSAMNHLD